MDSRTAGLWTGDEQDAPPSPPQERSRFDGDALVTGALQIGCALVVLGVAIFILGILWIFLLWLQETLLQYPLF